MVYGYLTIYKKILAWSLILLVLVECRCKRSMESEPTKKESILPIHQPTTSSDLIPIDSADNADNTDTPTIAATLAKTEPIAISETQLNALLDDIIATLCSLEPGDSKAIAPTCLAQFLEGIYNQYSIDKTTSQCYVAYAIAYGNFELLTLTLDCLQGDIDEPYEGGLTFLQYAVYFNNLAAIEWLLKKGARRDIVVQKNWKIGDTLIPAGSTAYDIALHLNRNEAAEKLRR
jgi:hypothetical protein